MKGMQKYEMKAVVGEGAYGKVFMARSKETGEIGKSLSLTLTSLAGSPIDSNSWTLINDLTPYLVSLPFYCYSGHQKIQRVRR